MPVDPRLAPNGVALLRIALGVMFIAHGLILKLIDYSLVGTAEFFVSLGLPAWTAYATFAAETVGGLMLVLGIQARWVALALTPIVAGAIWVHAGNGWVFSNAGGGWEYPAYLTLLSLVQAMLGDGAWALSRSRLPAVLRSAAWLPRPASSAN